eukprot:m.265825 g.265825  ORF g.265825 m.265825 type:complete len:60 (+) comp11065_c0_seq5:3506-3685(+)
MTLVTQFLFSIGFRADQSLRCPLDQRTLCFDALRTGPMAETTCCDTGSSRETRASAVLP